ncbi:MAG: hypothetical protein FWD16_01365 [Clostridia bacterium]|nr:hypothetical protein [Clostridia bacterium]
MIFDKNQTAFASQNQKKAWIMGKNIVPLDISLAKITGQAQREMFTQMYDFTVRLISDMYENEKKDDPFGFVRLFAEFSKNGKLENNDLVFPWVKQQDSADGRLFALWKDVLPRYGIILSEEKNESRLASTEYPLLLPAYFAMYEGAFRFNTGGWFYLAVCDFRVIEKGFAHSIDDLLRVLSDKDRHFAQELHEYALTLKVKPIKCIYPQRVFYKYKGIRILDMQIGGSTKLEFTVHPFRGGGIAREESQKLIARLEDKIDASDSPDIYREDFLKYIRYCNMCASDISKCPRGVHVPVWGQDKYLCHGVNFTTSEIDTHALDFFKTILRMRKEVIDEQ